MSNESIQLRLPDDEDALSEVEARLRGRRGEQGRYEDGRDGVVRDRRLGHLARRDFAPDDMAGRRRFLREVQVVGQLDLPGVPPIDDVGVDEEGRLFRTVAEVDGATFDEIASDPGRALEVLERAAETVAHAHEKGVVHGALSVDTVLAADFGVALVTDWGDAALLADGDHASLVERDVRAFGELLARVLDPTSSPELRAIADRAAAGGYPSLGGMIDDLRAFRESRVVHAYRTGRIEELRKWARRNRGFVVTAALAVVVGAALVAVYSKSLADAREVADTAARAAEDEATRVLRLSDLKEIADLEHEAEDVLWPYHPRHIEAMEAWLDRLRALLDRRDEHEAELARLEGIAGEASVWWRGVLGDVLQQLAALEETHLSADHGSSMPKRIIGSRWVGEATARYADEWDEAIRSIADVEESPMYGGLRIEPQVGLVPLGPDPDSGLWEFLAEPFGDVPTRDEAGRLVVDMHTGPVLVLLPGGELGPFFIGKYEWTQYQWRAVNEENPSRWTWGSSLTAVHPDGTRGATFRFSGLQPVEQVTGGAASTYLRRRGLELPTRDQWEYAAFAGSSFTYAYGPSPEDLAGHENVCDRSSSENPDLALEFDDGHALPTATGTYRPNAFGLHDMLGNVSEWTADTVMLGTGRARVFTGGNYLSHREVREWDTRVPGHSSDWIGFRAARRLDS